MDYHARLDNIQKVNTILWMAILAGMLVLLLVSWVLDMAGTFTPNPVARGDRPGIRCAVSQTDHVAAGKNRAKNSDAAGK
jgi:hypothetical protein